MIDSPASPPSSEERSFKWRSWDWKNEIPKGVLIGAIATVLLQLVIGPSFTWLRDFVLNVASLGLESYRDGTYELVAKGQYARVLDILGKASATTFVFVTWITFILAMHILWSVSRTEPLSDRQKAFAKRSLREGVAIVAFAALIVIPQGTQAGYVVNAAAYYEQLLAIAAPEMSTQEQAQIRREFAQIQGKSDYVAVVSRLQEINERAGQSMPAFDIW